MDIGDVFNLTDPRVNEHTYVVISHPEQDPDAIVLVNFTGYDEIYKDGSCVLSIGDHPRITKETCIYYRQARLAKESDLNVLAERGHLLMLAPASDSLLTKIFEGAEKTDEMPGKCRRVLERQGLIAAV